MLSPDNFRDFIQESLREQAKKMDQVLYHLDGPDCIRHLDAIMEIDEIDALQWTSGDAGPEMQDRMEHWKNGILYMTKSEKPANHFG